LKKTFAALKAGMEKVGRIVQDADLVKSSYAGSAVKPVFRKFN